MSPLFQGILIAVLAALLSGMITQYFLVKTNRREDAKSLSDEMKVMSFRIESIEKQQALFSQTVQPISTAFQALLIKQLTHYHTPKMDHLLTKIGPPWTLSEIEETELLNGLVERTTNLSTQIPESERDAAVMLPLLMKRVKSESQTMESIQFVAVPVTIPVTEKVDE